MVCSRGAITCHINIPFSLPLEPYWAVTATYRHLPNNQEMHAFCCHYPNGSDIWLKGPLYSTLWCLYHFGAPAQLHY